MFTIQTLTCLTLLSIIVFGGILWWNSHSGPLHDENCSAPDVYTSANVRAGVTYHVEHGGTVQDFEVVSIHWSGYFLVEVEPPSGHELDRDFRHIRGWAKELASNRIVEAHHLLGELPVELHYAPSYN